MYNLKIPKESVKIPKVKFQKVTGKKGFYNKFKTLAEVVATDEYKDVYSQFYDFTPEELEIKINPDENLEAYDARNNPGGISEERQLEEWTKCAENFFYFCHRYVKIFHPTDGLLRCVLYKYQRQVIEIFETNRFAITSKFRQGGLTTIAVLWALWKCMFDEDRQIMVLSKTDREAMYAGEICKRALDHFPTWLKPTMETESKHEKIFKETGSGLRFYTPEAARGKSVTFIIIDEAAFIKDMDTQWQAMYPTIATGGNCYVISTVNGIGNWYEETYHKAEAGKNEFQIIDLDYWLHPDYCNPEWVRKSRRNMGEKAWKQEVLRDFLGSGETYIPSHILKELAERTRDREPLHVMFEKYANKQANIDETKENWESGALWIWQEPKEGYEYIIGVDSAEGVGEDGDNSAFQVLNMQTMEQVAEFTSNRVPPNLFANVIQQIGILYNNALVVVENNSIGSAVASNLFLTLGYDNLYHESKRSSEGKPGIKVSSANRPIFLEALQNRLINGTIIINSRRIVSELNTFVYDRQKKRAEARKGRHDDLIMSLCIGIYIRDQLMHDVPIGSQIPEEMTKINSEFFEEIRQEILRSMPRDEFSKESDVDPFYFEEKDEEGNWYNFYRRQDKLLREFGW